MGQIFGIEKQFKLRFFLFTYHIIVALLSAPPTMPSHCGVPKVSKLHSGLPSSALYKVIFPASLGKYVTQRVHVPDKQ